MKLSTKIAYNTIVQIASKVLSTALALVAVAIITRHLGKTGFGEYTTILTFISFFAIIADFGLTLITVQMISVPNANEEKILGNLMAMRLVSGIVILGLAPFIVLFFPYSADVKLGVAVVWLSFLFVALNQIIVGLFQKNLRMDKVSISEVVSRVVLVVFTILAIKLEMGLNGILIATIISSLANFLLHYFFSKNFVKISLYFDFKYWLEILIKSWPLALTIALNLVYLKTDTLLLSLIERPSEIGIIAEVGIYGASYKVIDVLVSLPFMLSGILLPVLTLSWAEKRNNDFKNILQKGFDVLMIIAIPIAVGTQIIADEVMTFVAGKDFISSGPILKILILASTLVFIGNIFAHAIIAINKQRKIISTYVFVAVTSVMGYLIFIPKFSYIGAAWVTIYSETVIAFASVYIIWKYTKFIPSLKVSLKAFLASLAMGVIIFYTKNNFTTNLFLILIISGIAYLFFAYALRALTKKDVMDLLNK